MMDFEVARCTRQCAATGRQFEPGEPFYSILMIEGGSVVRYDYGSDAWEGPPEEAMAWWQSQMPERDPKKLNWAPNDVMLHLFEELAEQPEQADMRYVLTLLLVRRRVLRLEESQADEAGGEQLVVYSPRKETTWRVPVVTPGDARTREIQDHLAELLFAGADGDSESSEQNEGSRQNGGA